MNLLIRNRQRKLPVDTEAVRVIASETLNALAYPDVELSVSLVSDRKITELNRTYRNHNRPTDVLAFSLNEGDFGGINPGVLGDVVISLETAQRQAQEHRHSDEEELCLLLIHGILHLLGYDHEQGGGEAKKMRSKERALMKLMKDKGIVE